MFIAVFLKLVNRNSKNFSNSQFKLLSQKDLTWDMRRTEYAEEIKNFPVFLFVLCGNSEENVKFTSHNPASSVNSGPAHDEIENFVNIYA
jgi:hypothetical protein